MIGQVLNMSGTAMAYAGLVLVFAGLVAALLSLPHARRRTRRRGALVAVTGALIVGVGLLLPAPESRISSEATGLDRIIPAWQFREFHDMSVEASPARVYDAIRQVQADEIAYYHTLTWIRRGGKSSPPSILNAGKEEPILDVALRSGFHKLAEQPPSELVIATVVLAPPRTPLPVDADFFRRSPEPGFAIAAMNFLVRADGPRRSVVSTETRVFATDRGARRRFAVYWRLIYPGSALIRRMWLRAIARRAVRPTGR